MKALLAPDGDTAPEKRLILALSIGNYGRECGNLGSSYLFCKLSFNTQNEGALYKHVS